MSRGLNELPSVNKDIIIIIIIIIIIVRLVGAVSALHVLHRAAVFKKMHVCKNSCTET